MGDLRDHPDSVGFPANHPPMRSFLGVPIRRGETVAGSLYLTDKEGGEAFTEADEAAVEALGAYAAVAIHNLHHYLQLMREARAAIEAGTYAAFARAKLSDIDRHEHAPK